VSIYLIFDGGQLFLHLHLAHYSQQSHSCSVEIGYGNNNWLAFVLHIQSPHQCMGVRLIHTKNEKDAQFFGKVHPWDPGKKLRLVGKLGLEGPAQISLRSSWHVLWGTILSFVRSCLHKSIYSIFSSLQHWVNLKKGNLKVIQIRGGGDDTQAKKCKFCPKWLVKIRDKKEQCFSDMTPFSSSNAKR